MNVGVRALHTSAAPGRRQIARLEMNRILSVTLGVLLLATACSSSVPASPTASPPPGTIATPTATPLAPTVPASTPLVTPGSTPLATPDSTPAPTPVVTPIPTATPPPTPSPTPSPTLPPGSAGIQTLKVGQRDTSPQVSAADLQKLVKGNTAFAIDMYKQLRKSQNGNIVFGPYSISVAFGMLNPGAAGQTASEIDSALHFTLPLDRLDPAFDQLSLDLASRQTAKVQISIANRLFGQQGYPFQQPYLRELTEQFGAPMAAVDFKTQPEPARKLINRWVANQTNQRIKNLIPPPPPPMIKSDTRFVLVNAMYLNAKWANPFEAAFTQDDPFTRLDGTQVQVKTMDEEVTAPIAVTPKYQAIDLPYKGGKLSMLIVMPTNMTAFEKSLTPTVLSGVVDSLGSTWLSLQLPKFSIRTNAILADALKAMGIKAAFCALTSADCPNAADFSGMVDPADLERMHETLSVSQVIHQAWIKVGEAGTEAAAATAIIGGDTTGGGPDVSIQFNHPFLWFIRDRETGTILFMGRVSDPSIVAK